MLKYNICFVRRHRSWLLLNRESPSWMGCWNGVGGKLEPHETPRRSMYRELAEETGIADCELAYRGVVTWSSDEGLPGGMYLYMAEVGDTYRYDTPRKTEEGILDWKTRDWIMHPDNIGIASNIPVFLDRMASEPGCFDYHCVYRSGRLIRHTARPIGEPSEDAGFMAEYMRRYDAAAPV